MILWHSGTGNSRYVAVRLSQILGEDIRGICSFAGNFGACERIIWVFPVYSWGIPPVVLRYLREHAAEMCSCKHYLVMTCGDDVGLTDRQWRRELRRHGCRGIGAWSVRMPNNYVLLPGFDVDSDTVRDHKIAEADARIAAVARGIRVGARVEDVVRGSMAWLKSRILYPLFKLFLMSPEPFHATDECNGCGACARACPSGNISMESSRPHWGKNCTMCLGCYHRCPRHAVAYGTRTRGKGQYSYPSVP